MRKPSRSLLVVTTTTSRTSLWPKKPKGVTKEILDDLAVKSPPARLERKKRKKREKVMTTKR